MSPITRKHHRKTKTGCSNCKRRRVKCDERQPTCLNCTRRDLQCHFESRHQRVELAPKVPPTASPAAQLSLAPDHSRSHAIHMSHLELLHHFCTSTYHTLSHNSILRIMYQTAVVKIGCTCDYVMYSILSISALHLSRLNAEQERHFLSQALDLHHLALTTGSLALQNITNENCSNLYIFSVLTFMFDSARRREFDTLVPEEDTSLTEWISVLRGTRAVIDSSSRALLQDGPLGPLFTIGARRAQAQALSSTHTDHLWELQRLVNEVATSSDEIHTYNLSIDTLRLAFNVVFNKQPDTYEATDVFVWLYKLSDHFLELLSQRKPEALAILAHFSVLLKELDDRWWINGWSKRLISQVYGALGEEYRQWIVWPTREIGWMP
ncbi:hypothetical protein DL95DRAFT_381241 [Leptodontidium sp. 2 PMI_412]|nr:hypothetical protein DL95DRAFT_381241 [Leptodontidium sp. 2 PMI_412]